MRGAERGAVLLEAIVALAILSMAGAAALALVSSAILAEQEAMGREALQREANRVLVAASLLTRDDLDKRLGQRNVAGFIVSIQRPEPALYRVAVAAPDAPGVEMLVTVVHRPGP